MTIPRRRFRLAFSLRTLFVVLTAVGMGAGWFAHEWRIVRHRLAIMALIEHKTGFTIHDPTLHCSIAPTYLNPARRLLDDFPAVKTIVLPAEVFSAAERKCIAAAFGEAAIKTYGRRSRLANVFGEAPLFVLRNPLCKFDWPSPVLLADEQTQPAN